jgi:hypothetical protein
VVAGNPFGNHERAGEHGRLVDEGIALVGRATLQDVLGQDRAGVVRALGRGSAMAGTARRSGARRSIIRGRAAILS